PRDALLIIEPAAWDIGCSILYGPSGVDAAFQALRRNERRAVPKDEPVVVHLGDSMTFGEGVDWKETFPAVLDARQTDLRHANYGVWAVGTDFEYLLLQKVLAVHRVAMVVLHVYVGNDIYDIDRPYACCDAGPLLDYQAEGPAGRCAQARWRFTIGSRLNHSPP